MTDVRVLVVDDDPGVRSLVAKTLELEGLAPYSATNGAEAWAEVQARPPSFFSAIVLDLQMPVMDGAAFCRKLREAQIDVPVLLLAANGAAARRRELQADDAMAKPFDPFVLAEHVKHLTGHSHSSL